MKARRKDLSLHHVGMPVHQPVSADEIFGAGFDRLEEIWEAFIPRERRIALQDRQIKRRLEKLKKAKTEVGRNFYSKAIEVDLRQRSDAIRVLIAKYSRWKNSVVKLHSDKRAEALRARIRQMMMDGRKLRRAAKAGLRAAANRP
jgi:hypothetical protein